MAATAGGPHPGAPGTRRSVLPAGLVGVGLMAAVDQVVFHQLLHWHHLVDGPTPATGLVSDGVLHVVELLALLVGLELLARLALRGGLDRRAAWAGVVLGAGAFQLADGVISHKLLGLHQIRYGVDPLPYDVAWILSAVVLLALGTALLPARGRSRRRT